SARSCQLLGQERPSRSGRDGPGCPLCSKSGRTDVWLSPLSAKSGLTHCRQNSRPYSITSSARASPPVFPLAPRWDPRGWGVGRRAKRDTDLCFAARKVRGGAQRLRRIGITLSRAPPAGALQSAAHLVQFTLGQAAQWRSAGIACGSAVVPYKIPDLWDRPQHKLSRVKSLGYAARQLTIELPTSSDKVWWSERYLKSALSCRTGADFTAPRGHRLVLFPIAPGRVI